MRISVPAEIKANEHRVGLVLSSLKELTAKGQNVYVETGAGSNVKSSDENYIEAGAEILTMAEAVFQYAQMIVKVKEPQPEERARLTSDQILFTYLHLATDADQAAGLIASGRRANAYVPSLLLRAAYRCWRQCSRSLVACRSLKAHPA